MAPAPAGHPARRWADAWRAAWMGRDVDAVVALYAPSAAFSTHPFRPRYHGRQGVGEYVAAAFAEEADVRAWFGEPVIDGVRAAVEWWATLIEDGAEISLAGTSMLRFDGDGLVMEQRDTWNQADGRREPPEGWGR